MSAFGCYHKLRIELADNATCGSWPSAVVLPHDVLFIGRSKGEYSLDLVLRFLGVCVANGSCFYLSLSNPSLHELITFF
jgi:hypothetical protein